MVLTSAALAAAPIGHQKQMLGQALLNKMQERYWQDDEACDIISRLLHRDNVELLAMLRNEDDLNKAISDEIETGTEQREEDQYQPQEPANIGGEVCREAEE